MTRLFSVSATLHIWIGPAGLHVFWPDLWHTRPDWCAYWREPME